MKASLHVYSNKCIGSVLYLLLMLAISAITEWSHFVHFSKKLNDCGAIYI